VPPKALNNKYKGDLIMNTATVALISTIINAILQAIPFVEKLFGKGTGPAKAAAVMNIAQIAASPIVDGIVQNNPSWAAIAPLAQQFIDGAVKVMNDIGAPAPTELAPADPQPAPVDMSQMSG
jgi:hypothetical protein